MSSIRQLISEISQFKNIDDVSYLQPEVPLTTTTVENLKWFGQELTSYELTNQWIERLIIYHTIDPKGQRDLQCHIIFYMTTKSEGLPRPLWPNCGSIQRHSQLNV